MAFVMAVLSCSCGEKHTHTEHEHEHTEAEEHEHEHEHAAGEIIFKKANAEAIGLTTEKIAPAPFAEVIKTSGQIQAAPYLAS